MMYAVKMFDKPGSAALRDANRDEHLAYLKSFDDQTWFAGPMLADDGEKVLGSFRLMDFAHRAAANEHVGNEPYIKAGLQDGVLITRWSPSVEYTYKNCPRTEGNIQFLIIAIDKPGSSELRESARAEHRAYQGQVSKLYITRGPLLSEDGAGEIGSLMIIDVPDRETARDFWANEPFNTVGLFDSVEFYRWRFGRVFDRYKSGG